jgi:hypothetical protein
MVVEKPGHSCLGQKVLEHENAWFQVAPSFTCFFRPMWTAPESTGLVSQTILE